MKPLNTFLRHSLTGQCYAKLNQILTKLLLHAGWGGEGGRAVFGTLCRNNKTNIYNVIKLLQIKENRCHRADRGLQFNVNYRAVAEPGSIVQNVYVKRCAFHTSLQLPCIGPTVCSLHCRLRTGIGVLCKYRNLAVLHGATTCLDM